MNKRELSSELRRRVFILLLVGLALGGAVAAWRRVAARTPDRKPASASAEVKSIAIHASGRGAPHVNFTDGTDLRAPVADAAGGAASPTRLTAADFDSDGVADLVTADAGGVLRFYRGVDVRREAAAGRPTDIDPFAPTETVVSTNVAPDFLVAGDFNADGRQDILVSAKFSDSLSLIAGDGRGNFAAPARVPMPGRVTALAAGEIGRGDGQTDVAAALSGKNGAFLLVFEHPEGAFKHKPEVFRLAAPATDLAIGDLDGDFYADVAVASGDELTVVHGRGQAYPWDLIAASGIKRPAAVVETRRLPFAISALAVGHFGARRGDSLALLGAGGDLYELQPKRAAVSQAGKLPPDAVAAADRELLLPTGADAVNLAIFGARPATDDAAKLPGVSLFSADELRGRRLSAALEKRQKEAAENAPVLNPKELDAFMSDGTRRSKIERERAKEGFLRTLAGRPSPLEGWTLGAIASGSPFASAAASEGTSKIIAVNVSDGDFDDLLVVDRAAGAIGIVSPVAEKDGSNAAPIARLDVVNGLEAVLPVKANLDALSDLVVLRKGAAAPSVVMSAPASFIHVTTTGENGDCLTGNPCSLRNAILLANASPGADSIIFDLGAGFHTIAPATELPVITNAISIQGFADQNGNKLVEISGVDIASGTADGLKVRTSNSFIFNLAINKFPGVRNSDGSVTGGSAVTLESTANGPRNGNNFVTHNYLGTDPTGSFAKANMGAGLNIFDSDQNYVADNVMSGNDSRQTLGVGLAVTAGNSNDFYRNIIGLNSLGTGKLGNVNGVFFAGANNNFGGSNPGDGNTVSGNGVENPNFPGHCVGQGMMIPNLVDLQTNELIGLGNKVAGNRFGTNPAGTLPLGNCSLAINTSPLTQTTIGAVTPEGRNIVADNGFNAIACAEEFLTDRAGGFCAIAGNNIGTDITGTVAMPNNDRNYAGGVDRIRGTVDIVHNNTLSYFGAPGGTTPGGACTGFCNLYSANNPGIEEDIYFTGRGTIGFFNNYIGTNAQGTAALPNAEGIRIGNVIFGRVFVGAVGRDENNAPVALGNLISGQLRRPLVAGTFGSDFPGAGYFSSVSLYGNKIGTDATGSVAIPNDSESESVFGSGVNLSRGFTETNVVGGTDPLERNIISGNRGNGLVIRPFFGGRSYPLATTVVNNLIGLNSSLAPLGNGANGIEVQDGSGAAIGGTDEEANQIAYNGTLVPNAAGVLIDGFPGAFNRSRRITVRNNSIHDNAGLGIDLNGGGGGGLNGGGDGVTPNDACDRDADAGANDLQNFPELSAPVFGANGAATVEGILQSSGRQHFTIDFYANRNFDASGHGETEIHLGAVDAVTDGNGFASFTFTSIAPVNPAFAITATATDDLGNTSEASCAAGGGCSALAKYRGVGDYLAAAPAACALSLVVNLDGDDPDANLADGVCDIDISNDDPHECTLRAALQIVTQPNYVGTHNIDFNIPGGGVHTISPQTPLPTITNFMTIDATTQPGYVDSPLVELRGDNVLENGFLVQSGSTTIRGFAVNGFASAGVKIAGFASNRVESCFIGVNPDGVTADPSHRMQFGVLVEDSESAVIGGAQGGNVISNNVTGVVILRGSASSILGNKIGTDKSGTLAIPNTAGVNISASNGNSVGTKFGVDGNVISGNSTCGVVLENTSSFNKIWGNYIGTQTGGFEALGNGQCGIYIRQGAGNNEIGNGFAPTGRNVIGGHNASDTSAGVLIDADAGVQNRILGGNLIGMSVNPLFKIPNRTGVVVFADDQRIGGSSGNPFNVISGNQQDGILVLRPAGSPNEVVNSTQITYNYVGTDSGSHASIGNGRFGIFLSGRVDGSTVRGNIVGGNLAGILVGPTPVLIDRPSNNFFEDNKIGINENTDTPIPNGAGMILRGTFGNRVKANVISGNQFFGLILGKLTTAQVPAASLAKLGLDQPATKVFMAAIEPPENAGDLMVDELPTSDNRVYDNRIGVDKAGVNPYSNGRIGLVVGENARDNCIGSCDPAIAQGGAGNVVSGHADPATAGNLGYGVFLGSLSDNPDPLVKPSGNRLRDNVIGTSRDMSFCIPNHIGIFVFDAGPNVIGEQVANFRHGNVITCNYYNAVRIDGQNEGVTSIDYNWIGTTPFIGKVPILDRSQFGGIRVITVTETERVHIRENDIGGFDDAAIEVVNSAGARPETVARPDGIQSETLIIGNRIGVQRDESGGYFAIPNAAGIRLVNAVGVTIGSSLPADFGKKNVVSGNTGPGIEVTGGFNNRILNSIIGTDEFFSASLGNGVGIKLNDAVGTAVGGIGSGLRNIISKNNGFGVLINGANAAFNRVKNNLISENSADGVLISDGTRRSEIGGPEENAGNTIANNGGAGVLIAETAGEGNLVDPNSIYGNAGLGIDIGPAGRTPNDPGDADTGANNLQNYPEIVSRQIVGGELIVGYRVDSAPANSNYGQQGLYVEFFKSDASGEGERFLGFDYYTVADFGGALAGVKTVNLGDINTLGIAANDLLTASATDADGNTSEFFPPFAPTAASVTLGGRLRTTAGGAIAGAKVQLTNSRGETRVATSNSFGIYRFESVSAGETYVLTVAHRKFNFPVGARVFAAEDSRDDLDFEGAPD